MVWAARDDASRQVRPAVEAREHTPSAADCAAVVCTHTVRSCLLERGACWAVQKVCWGVGGYSRELSY